MNCLMYLINGVQWYLGVHLTWLLNDHLHKLGSIHENYTFTGVSGMDSDKKNFRGRPYGGTAILYKNI